MFEAAARAADVEHAADPAVAAACSSRWTTGVEAIQPSDNNLYGQG